MKVKVKKINNNSSLPEKGSKDAMAFDLFSDVTLSIPTQSVYLIPTGIALEPPAGYGFRINERSGWASLGLNIGAGNIDSDYRGEIKVVARNVSDEPIKIKKGDKIAQIRLVKVHNIELEEVETLTETERGEKGFGSTDIAKEKVG